MNLKKEFQVFLTKCNLVFKIYCVKTMIFNALFVNNGNDKNPYSYARSHAKALNNRNIYKLCEQVNNFSRTYVKNYFYIPFLDSIFLTTSIFIFFLCVCVSVLLFTYSHLNKINIKTITYHVNDYKNSFTCYSHCSHEG